MSAQQQQAHSDPAKVRASLEQFGRPIDRFLYSPDPRITALKGFQRTGAKHMITWKATINGACTGSGKTVTTISAIDVLDLFPAVIVCGSRVALQWAGEFIHWLKLHTPLRPGLTVSLLEGESPRPFENRYIKTLAGDVTISVPLNDLSADVVIAPYSIVYGWGNALAERGNRVLVCDECHRVNRVKPRVRSGGNDYPVIGTRQAVACWHLARKVVPTYYFQHIYGLSADAVVNRPKDLCGILEILGVMWCLGGREAYLARYCGREGRVIFGRDGQIRRYWDDNGASNLEELHTRLKDLGLLFRVTKQEALPDMPANTEVTIPVTISNQAEYDRAEADLLTYIREMALIDRELNERLEAMSADLLFSKCQEISARTKVPLPADVSPASLRDYLRQAHANDVAYRTARARALSRITVLRRLVGEGKVEAVIEWLNDFFVENPGQKILVFVHHRSAQKSILAAFPSAARILGGQSLAESDANKHRFQRDPDCTMILVAQAAGDEGLNLSAGYYSLIVEWPWTGKAINQMIGRSNGRMDRPHEITAFFMHAAGSQDDDVRRIIQHKRQMSSMILDGKAADGILSQNIGDELVAAMVEREGGGIQ